MRKLRLTLAITLLVGTITGCSPAPALPPDTEPTSNTTEAPDTTAVPETTPLPADLPEIELPEFYETRTVRPTSVTPEIDGVLTSEEWGGKPDYRLGPSTVTSKRNYCRDNFAGSGTHFPECRYYFRYDEKYIYVAAKIREPKEYVSAAPITQKGSDRSFSVNLGGATVRLIPEEGTITDAVGNMCYGYTYDDGAHCIELAAPIGAVLGLVDGKPGFTGFAEFIVTVYYERHDGIQGTAAAVTTRTTPMFENENFTHDVFLLGEGLAAPAPELSISYGVDTTIDPVQLDGFTLQFSDPVVLDQGAVGDQVWGHYQFPGFTRYTDGSIRAGWSYSRDTIEYKSEKNPNGVNYATSYDNGKTWTLGGESEGYVDARPMPNGKYFVNFAGKGAYAADYLDAYTPVFTFSGYKMFFAEDIAEVVDKTVTAYEYDPATGKSESFTCTINWPYMPLVQFPGGLVYPLTQVFTLSARAIISVDGALYLPLYFYGFDSFADSRETAVNDSCKKYSVYMFKSSDSGRTWDLLSQIMTDEKIQNASEGVCEPEMTVMPDGSFVMLMRTGSDNPCYIVRSTDRGITWSAPVQFDRLGVLPQLLTLDCGVTLASYGRPTMRFAATSDPTGVTWSEPFDIPITGGEGQSCFYTDLLAIDDHTALFIYTDFMYPNENGAPVKTILVRTVTVVPD